MNPSFLRFSYHMIKHAVAGRGCLMDRVSYDVEPWEYPKVCVNLQTDVR